MASRPMSEIHQICVVFRAPNSDNEQRDKPREQGGRDIIGHAGGGVENANGENGKRKRAKQAEFVPDFEEKAARSIRRKHADFDRRRRETETMPGDEVWPLPQEKLSKDEARAAVGHMREIHHRKCHQRRDRREQHQRRQARSRESGQLFALR